MKISRKIATAIFLGDAAELRIFDVSLADLKMTLSQDFELSISLVFQEASK
ncbi:hypothetical protein [Saccharophagus sp. K07]|uniref:hypothetical protein n=1 Tax=Saccharophagus sp. K07 TaxID=2283636 RepID=UPI001651E322|nr:hypothetical protein [Saccharophagus sp. K07]